MLRVLLKTSLLSLVVALGALVPGADARANIIICADSPIKISRIYLGVCQYRYTELGTPSHYTGLLRAHTYQESEISAQNVHADLLRTHVHQRKTAIRGADLLVRYARVGTETGFEVASASQILKWKFPELRHGAKDWRNLVVESADPTTYRVEFFRSADEGYCFGFVRIWGYSAIGYRQVLSGYRCKESEPHSVEEMNDIVAMISIDDRKYAPKVY